MGEAIFDVFIIHARADAAHARVAYDALGREGLRSFLDQPSTPLDVPWTRSIPEALEASRAAIVLVGSDGHYNHDEQVRAIERYRAHQMALFVVYLRGRHPNGPDYGLRAMPGFFLEVEKDFDRIAQQLRVALGTGTNALAARLAEARARLRGARRTADEPARLAALDEVRHLNREMQRGGQLRPGLTLCSGRFFLLERLGEGAFAQVWRADDDVRAHDVALKIMKPSVAADPGRRKRFFRGALQMQALDHPHVVRVLDAHLDDDEWHLFSMEYLPGGTLEEAIVAGRLPAEQVGEAVTVIGDALASVHAKKQLHRDVKPSNILLDARGVLKLGDFDLVRAKDTGAPTSNSGMGSVGFTAPEVLEGIGEPTPKADVYSLAMTAFFGWHRSWPGFLFYADTDGYVDCLVGPTEGQRVALREALRIYPPEARPTLDGFCAAMRGDEPSLPQRGDEPSLPQRGDEPSLPQPDTRPRLLLVDGGTFWMGSTEGDEWAHSAEHRRHEVTVSPFWLAETPVTQAQYAAVTNQRPSHRDGDDRSVERVSWADAVAYCNALSASEGLEPAYADSSDLVPGANGYRLPTEAEWEYACRAGTETPWFFGDAPDALGDYAWFEENSGGETRAVATRRPNPWGFYDQLGNVWEWVHDWWSDSYDAGSQTDPTGPRGSVWRVFRGGAFGDSARDCRPAFREGWLPRCRDLGLGFRVARPAPSPLDFRP